MGLLDFLNTGDPQKDAAISRGLLTAGLQLMQSRGKFLPALGQGGMAGIQGFNTQQQLQHLQKMQDAQLYEVARRKKLDEREDLLANLPAQFYREPLTHDGLPAKRNPDGSISTELSITVTDPRLNGGRPTNIPSLWGGNVLDEGAAVDAALRSGRQFEAFDSIDSAVSAAKQRSASKGIGSFDLEGLAQKYMATPGGFQSGLALQQALRKDTTPIKLGANERLLSPDGRTIVGALPDKPAEQPSAIREYQFAVGQGYKGSFEQWDRERRKAGATNVTVSQGGVPHQVLKQQDEIIDRLTTARAIDADLGGIEQRITSGKLEFGPVSNLVSQGRNAVGMSNEQSRNFATFKSTLEKLRNDSLRLNAGVQTEGDAQRAWNELFQSINDKELVMQRLAEIRKINQRAAKLQEYRLDVLRGNFSASPLPTAPVEPAIDAPSGAWDAEKERRYQEWKAKQK